MSRLFLAVVIFVAALIALTPPGLCPCWLNPDVETNHVHFRDVPDSNHSHEYLNELSQASLGEILPILLIPAAIFIALESLSTILWELIWGVFSPMRWKLPLSPPPPKLLSAF